MGNLLGTDIGMEQCSFALQLCQLTELVGEDEGNLLTLLPSAQRHDFIDQRPLLLPGLAQLLDAQLNAMPGRRQCFQSARGDRTARPPITQQLGGFRVDLAELGLQSAQPPWWLCQRGSYPGARSVQYVDGLVRQLPSGNVSACEHGGSLQGVVTDEHLVRGLVDGAKPAQDVHGLLLCRLLQLDELKTAGQGWVLLEVLLVLGPGRRGDRAQLAARQCRLEEIGGVAPTGGVASADKGMGFVDE
ncbi:hypothetical protein D3C78_895880 [compost metagenome]